MGVLQRFERRIGGLVEGIFARAFKSEVQPVEVAAALQRELDDQAAVLGKDRTLVPNHFVVELGDHDHTRLMPYETPLTHELAAMVREHADDQRYTFVGPVQVELRHLPALETGVFHVRSEVTPGPEGMPDLGAPAPVHVRPDPTAGQPIDGAATTAIPRAAAKPASGRIRVREGKNAAYDVELRHTVTVIGRGTDADVRLTDQAVSRRHAEIRLVNGATLLNDLQSTNGTTVNGVAVTTTALKDGDEIRLGETVLLFHAATGPADAGGSRGAPGGRALGRASDIGSWG